MLIVGAKGFAIEVLEILDQLEELDNVAFYDDINSYEDPKKFNRFPILTHSDQAKEYFKTVDNKYTLGVGGPGLRLELAAKLDKLGGKLTSIISPFARFGTFGNSINEGCNIMTNVLITNEINIGKACLINLNVTIGHNTIIGDFVEVCPGVNISGNTSIGSQSFIGTNTTILPGICIGKNTVIGAHSLVTKDIPDNVVAVGSPAKIIKQINA